MWDLSFKIKEIVIDIIIYYYYHLSVKGRAQKIESTCAVDTYVAKPKFPMELSILHTNGSETS